MTELTGTITQNLGAGKYMVSVHRDLTRLIDEYLPSLSLSLDNVTSGIGQIDSVDLPTIDSELSALESLLEALIESLNNASDVEKQGIVADIGKITLAMNRKIAEKQTTLSRRGVLLLDKSSVGLEIKVAEDTVDKYEDADPVAIWCVHPNLDLSGDIVLLTSYSESGNKYLNISGHDGTFLRYPRPLLQPIENSGSWAIVYNMASMPAFQKYKPTHVHATVLEVNSLNFPTSIKIDKHSSSMRGFDGTTYPVADGGIITDMTVNYPVEAGEKLPFAPGHRVVMAFGTYTPRPWIVVGYIGGPSVSVPGDGEESTPLNIKIDLTISALYAQIGGSHEAQNYRAVGRFRAPISLLDSGSDYVMRINGQSLTLSASPLYADVQGMGQSDISWGVASLGPSVLGYDRGDYIDLFFADQHLAVPVSPNPKYVAQVDFGFTYQGSTVYSCRYHYYVKFSSDTYYTVDVELLNGSEWPDNVPTSPSAVFYNEY